MAVFKIEKAQNEASHTQNLKIQTCLFSLLSDLFDCKKTMLEAGQPGELPLLKELSSLRRVRSLRDPSTGSNGVGVPSSAQIPSGKSPNLGFIGKNKDSKGDQHTMGRIRHQLTAYDGKTSMRRGFPPSVPSPLSDPLHTSENEWAWDLGMDPEQASISSHMKRKPVIKPHHVEAFQQHKPHHNGQTLLHNWRDPSWASDMEASHATAYSIQDQKGASRHHRSFDLSGRGESGSHSGDAYQFQNEMMYRLKGRIKRIPKATVNGSKQHPEVLSPLVLNSHDDLNYHGNSLSVFSLEGNYHERRDRLNGVAIRGLARSDISSSHSPPQFSKGLAKKGLKEGGRINWKSQHMLASSTSTSQRTASQSSVSGAWEATSNQLEDELDVCELPKNGCGIPCYWSKSQKRGKSFLDIAERSFSCGLYPKSPKKMVHSGSRQHLSGPQGDLCGYPGHELVPPLDLEALPLLSDPSQGSEDFIGSSAEDSDKISSDLNGELGLQGGELRHACNDGQDDECVCKELAIYNERPRSLSQKYRPKLFDELVGQNFVAQALSNAIQRRKIAPVYLFQGSRGTGKTSAARIFAAALNCVTLEEQRPCGICKECLAFASGKSLDIKEVDAASNNAVEKVKALLQTAFSAPSFSQFKVFIIDECHMLTNETWNALLKLLEEPPRNVVFMLITTDPDKLPPTAVSRCQKFPFPKIKESEIVGRLESLAKLENLCVERGSLELVASRSDGSLRDAEIILDQLSLLGQKITVSTVHELFGSVSDEKLLGLLDFALSSDTVNTVQRARQLIDSGVEPLDLMVQLATLITDILAGSNEPLTQNQEGTFFSNHALSEEELERLRYALQVLSEAEKQLRAASNDRTTWLTAALLQLGPARACTISVSTSCTSASTSPAIKSSHGSRQVFKIINGKNNHRNITKGLSSGGSQKKAHSLSTMKSKSRSGKSGFDMQVHPEETSNLSSTAFKGQAVEDLLVSNGKKSTLIGPGNLETIWCNVLERCKSPPIRQLLQSHGKLLAVSISADGAIVVLEIDNLEHKSRSERCKKSIATFFQEVLGLPVDVKISIASAAKALSSVGARVQVVVDQQEAHSQSQSKIARPQQHEETRAEVGSLHYWRSQSRTETPRTLEHIDSAGRFPSLLTLEKAKAADSEHTMRNPNGTPHFENGIKPFQRVELDSGGPWSTKARAISLLQRPQNGVRVQEIILDNGADSVKAAAMVAPKSGFSYDLEEENLRLESQSKYGGLLCWRSPIVEDEKASKNSQKGCGFLMKLVPCGKSER